MTLTQVTNGRPCRGVSLFAAVSACLVASEAAAETYATVDISAGGTAATNPYLVNGSDTEAVGANLTVDPTIVFEGEATTFRIDGRASIDQYLNRYGTDEALSLSVASKHQINERTTISGNLNFNSSRSVSSNRFLLGQVGIGELEPGQFPEGLIIDPTLAGLGGRANTFVATFGVDHQLDATSNLSLSGSTGWTWVEDGFGEDYRNSLLGVRYRKRLSEKTALVGRVEGGYADYRNQDSGDSVFVTSMAGAERQLSETTSLSAQLGASWVSGKTVLGTTDRSLSFAAALDLCKRAETGNGCVTLSRRPQPTAAGGVSTITAVSVSYFRLISAREQISVSANYGRSSGLRSGPVPLANRGSEVIGATASYSRRLSDRLSAYVSPSFTSASDRVAGSRENLQALIGVSYRLGQLR
jgi:hypothetical protein